MLKRTIEVSREPVHLCARHGQLVLQRDGEAIGQAPFEDLGMIVVDHPRTSYSHGALVELASSGSVLVVCGRNHLPVAMMLPLSGHSEVVSRLMNQIAMKKPLKKRLWRQLVVSKIRGQARNLERESAARRQLIEFSKQVRSGDPENLEAQAAKAYWSHWLGGEAFQRIQDGDGLNSLLNYGYAIARAGIARAIVASGLHPSLGIHHHHRSNAFCLADDLIEPFRPQVDRRVRSLWQNGVRDLDQAAKAELLGILTTTLRLPDGSGPWTVMVSRMVASLVHCVSGEASRLEIPTW
jgi:CRISP-associated protein Cas1